MIVRAIIMLPLSTFFQLFPLSKVGSYQRYLFVIIAYLLDRSDREGFEKEKFFRFWIEH